MVRVSLCFLLIALPVGWFVIVVAAQRDVETSYEWPIPGGKVGKAGKNLQILPFNELFELVTFMQSIEKALGVGCVYCHNLEDFSLDDPKAERAAHKRSARIMMRMLLNLKEYFARHQLDKEAVGCFTCHRGQLHPPSQQESPAKPEEGK